MKSKFDNATPPDLFSGPKLAIWSKNQQPSLQKTPLLSEKSETAMLPPFSRRRSLGEKAICEYFVCYTTVFNFYDIYTTPDICHILHISHFFYTTTIWGLKILHLKVRKCTTKVASRQNSVNLHSGAQIHISNHVWYINTVCKIIQFV